MEEEVLDNWLINGRTSTTQQFRTDISRYNEARSKMLYRTVFLLAAAGAVTYTVMYIRSDSSYSSRISLLIGMIVFAGLMTFNVIHTMKRFKKVFESFVLTIENDTILREQYRTPDVSIHVSEIRSIAKRPNGTIVITGQNRHEKILVPAQVERPGELEAVLQHLHPFNNEPVPFVEKFSLAISLLSAGMAVVLMYVDDKRFVAMAAAVVLPLYAWGVMQRFQSRNLAYNTVFSKISALVFLVAMTGLTVWKLTR